MGSEPAGQGEDSVVKEKKPGSALVLGIGGGVAVIGGGAWGILALRRRVKTNAK